MLKIVVNDYLYAEYGLEKEIVNKAAEKYNIAEDKNFEDILEYLAEYKNPHDSFLKIF